MDIEDNGNGGEGALAGSKRRPIPAPGQKEWSQLSPDKREPVLERIGDWCADDLDTNRYPVRVRPLEPDEFAQWDSEEEQILIDTSKVGNIEDAVGSIAHESFHSYQQEQLDALAEGATRVDNRANEWATNIRDGYIDGKFDPEGYHLQPIERDADDYEQMIRRQFRREKGVPEKTMEWAASLMMLDSRTSGSHLRSVVETILINRCAFRPAHAAEAAGRLTEDRTVAEYFLRWNEANTVPSPTELSVRGYSVQRLVAELKMTVPGAFLALAWLMRDPEEAERVLRRGFDRPIFRKK